MSPLKFLRSKGIIFFIPVIICVLSLFLKMATGPYWLGPNSDPAYLYLINSLYILQHISPAFVDHPGTTLEVLGAIVIKLLNWSVPQQQLIDNVLLNPEYYLNAQYFLILFLNITTLFFLGLYALKKSKDVIFSLFVQSGAFAYLLLKSYGSRGHVLTIASNVFAESLFPFISNLFILCILFLYFSERKKNHYLYSFLFAIFSAAGVITKVSFAPLLIIPFLMLRGFRAKLLFVGIFIASCFLLTIPIIPEYKEMFNYIYLFQANKGIHGTGGVGMLSFQQMLVNAKGFFRDQPFLLACILAGIVSLLCATFFWRRINWQKERMKKDVLYLGILFSGVLLQIIFVLKHPAPHYAAPAVGLLGILLTYVYLIWTKAFLRNRAYFAVILFFIVSGFSVATVLYQTHLKETNHAILQFSQNVKEKYKNCILCNFYRSSSVAYALYFGDDCKGRHRAFFPRLKELYPRALVWNRWDYDFHHFSDQVSEESILNANPCVLLYGSHMDFSISYINAELIESSEGEYLYKVISSSRKDVMQVFLLSKALEIKGDYKTALIFAMKARDLGFPRLRIDRNIEELKAKIKNE